MTIGIDASRAVKPIRTGPENYSWELLRRLVTLDSKVTFRLYAPHQPKEAFLSNPNIDWRILPEQRLWSQFRLAKEIRQNPPDVLFIPSHVVPLFSNVPTVVTIHDLAYQYFPQSYSNFDRRYLAFSTGVSASKARKIIVPSESTKRDLLKEYRELDGRKIVVIPHAYNQDIFKPSNSTDQPPVDPPYIFFVGRIEQKKNVRLLIEAFALLAKEKKTAKLVLSGRAGFGHEAIQQAIQALPPAIRNRIIEAGYLPQYDMVRYLQHATVFAFPSQYEGFGLAALEAMATGVPVVCSNTSSLPEVVGDTAITLPPTNALSWAAAFSRIMNQPELAKQLSTKAMARAKQFSWQRTAEATLVVLKNAI